MNKEIFKIPEIKNARDELRRLKREVNRKRLKFKTIVKKYEFVIDIISPEIDDFKLENQVLKLFENLGYDAEQPTSTRDVDGIVKLKDCIVGIEVKNSYQPKENELFQALKYCKRSEKKGIIMKPLIVWNNAKTNQNFDQYQIEDAVNNKYGIITTKELLKGFMKVKQGILFAEKFEKIILKPGLITFSNKAILESG